MQTERHNKAREAKITSPCELGKTDNGFYIEIMEMGLVKKM
jgi:hypothetical protein